MSSTRRIRTVAATGSTNADLLALARDGGCREGFWLRAERQTAGRGRQGRAWESPAGNLYASTVVVLRAGDPPAPTLALVAAVALDEAVRAIVPDPAALQLKWPNDLLIGGAKLSGILLERTGDHVVIGFGVNVAAAPPIADRAVASLAAHGARVDAATLLDLLAGHMADGLAIWRTQGVAAVAARWCARAHPRGTMLTVRLPDGTTAEGRFAGLDAGGALALDVTGGERRIIHAGDVFLV